MLKTIYLEIAVGSVKIHWTTRKKQHSVKIQHTDQPFQRLINQKYFKFNPAYDLYKYLPPLSTASIKVSVSLLRMQSISWRCEYSLPKSSRRRLPGARFRTPAKRLLLSLGTASRPSYKRIRRRSHRRNVSRQDLKEYY